MKRFVDAKILAAGLALAAFPASPLLAHGSDHAGKQPQMCEMMHGGQRMQGMMMKDKDGKMTCQMMDHSKMDHSKMDHGEKAPPAADQPAADQPDAAHKHDHQTPEQHR